MAGRDGITRRDDPRTGTSLIRSGWADPVRAPVPVMAMTNRATVSLRLRCPDLQSCAYPIRTRRQPVGNAPGDC